MSNTAPKSEEGFTFQVNGGCEAGGLARRAFVAGDGALPGEVREDVLLLMTELVTNSVRHAGVEADQSLLVEVLQGPQRVRVAVVDPGSGFTRVQPRFRSDPSGGWGLFLVDRIADRWGVDSEASGTRVWFEIEFQT
jgi:anti-sigma regulatory factor (Ser/Thr protein kinase)